MTIDTGGAAKIALCGARYYPANGEYVSPCHKAVDHEGEHEGRCLGSRAVWTSDLLEDGDDPIYREATP